MRPVRCCAGFGGELAGPAGDRAGRVLTGRTRVRIISVSIGTFGVREAGCLHHTSLVQGVRNSRWLPFP